MSVEVEPQVVAGVRLNRRYRGVVHSEPAIYRSDIPSEISPGRLEIQRKKDGKIVGKLPVDLTGMFEVTDLDRRQWRSMGQRFLQDRSKKPR